MRAAGGAVSSAASDLPRTPAGGTMDLTHIDLNGLQIEVVRKQVKHVRLTVYPPDGRVRVSAPKRMSRSRLNRILEERTPWIEKQRQRIASRPHLPVPRFESGENHLYQGLSYRLNVHITKGPAAVVAADKPLYGSPDGPGDRPGDDPSVGPVLMMYVRENSTAAKREEILMTWYRQQLKAQIPGLLARWEPVVGVRASDWGVKRMKTRWGSCNIRAGRIWLNLELAKKPVECLEYVIVHELVHLLERGHNARFWGLMDGYMPAWRQHRAALKDHSTAIPGGPYAP